jgi:hypothetical protein
MFSAAISLLWLFFETECPFVFFQDVGSKEQASGIASLLFIQMPLEARSAESELFGNHFYLPMSLKEVH